MTVSWVNGPLKWHFSGLQFALKWCALSAEVGQARLGFMLRKSGKPDFRWRQIRAAHLG
jgi:hypothetical protein